MSTQQQPPSEEELRAAYEKELARLTSTDVMAQAAVSLLNIGARRLAPAQGEHAGDRDLEQARDAIDGARALLEILERRIPRELVPLRDALSQLQMAYARELSAAPASAPASASEPAAPASPAAPTDAGTRTPARAGGPEPGGAPQPPAGAPEQPGERPPGPAESSGRLWVPGR